MTENFKTIQGFPDYEIGDAGSVYSRKSEKLLRAVVDERGRCKVNLTIGGKRLQQRIHRLVAEHFVGPAPFPTACVRHLNDNPSDNRKENLAWGTHQDNMDDKVRNGNSGKGGKNGNARLTEDQVRAIRSGSESRIELSRKYGISPAQIARIIRGERWGHVT